MINGLHFTTMVIVAIFQIKLFIAAYRNSRCAYEVLEFTI